jgi:hypothetical protein
MPNELPNDVFLSHSAKDKRSKPPTLVLDTGGNAVVRDPAERLKKDGLRVWFAMFAIVILTLLPAGSLHATSYRDIGLGEMVETSDLILLVKLTPAGEKLDVQVEDVLKGVRPHDLVLHSQIYSFESDGVKKRHAGFGGDARVDVDELAASNRRIIFLRPGHEGRFLPFHPDCVQPEAQKKRVLEILAMRRNPAPFVSSGKFEGDVDLIYLLGVQFFPVHVTAPAVPAIESWFRPGLPVYEEMPWQHVRFMVQFAFQPSRQPMLQMKPFAAKGVLPDFIRKLDANHEFERYAAVAREKLPTEFDVTVDTTGPKKVGDLTFAAATDFLRAQLRSEKLQVIEAAYRALVELLDSDAVPIANEMLRHPDRRFRREAAKFLAYAKDPRSVEPLCAALDELPPCVRYGFKGYNDDDNELSGAVGKAVLNLRDPRTVPALKRAALKGYAGDWIAMTLSMLGDETAFEPLLSHLRNPDVNHYPDELVRMIQRSNVPVEAWMKKGLSSDDYAGKRLRATRWIEWWDAHKKDFRIVRTWEEAYRLHR